MRKKLRMVGERNGREVILAEYHGNVTNLKNIRITEVKIGHCGSELD
jgi:hypothetical protein